MPANVVSIPEVELVKVGRFMASTGPVTITEAHLVDMAAAAADPEIDHAPLKIGHLDSRFSGDGDPALGWVEKPVRRGASLFGTLADVPRGLASLLPKAFRRRSVEVDFGPGGAGVVTPSGRRYSAVLRGLAALGVTPPAVKGLADIEKLYAADEENPATGLDVVDGIREDRQEALAVVRRDVVAALSAAGRSEDEVMAAVDRFDAGTGAAPEAQMRQNGAPPVHDGSETRGGSVALTDERIRELLGAEEGDDLEARITELVNASDTGGEGDGEGEGDGDGAETPPPDQPAPGEEGQPPAAAPDETQSVTISQGQLDELIRNARAGAEARAQQTEEQVDSELVAALSAGKVTPAEWQSLRDGLLNPQTADAFRANLAARPAGIVPTVELGSPLASFSADSGEEAAWAALDRDVFGISDSKAGA